MIAPDAQSTSRSAVDFAETPHCRREAHCRTCRDREGGRKWREGIAKRYAVEGVDWECPLGHPWGYEGRSRGLGDTVAKVIKAVTFGRLRPCGGCRKRRSWLNKVIPYRKRSRDRRILA